MFKPPKHSVTIKDIASKLKMSHSTVSRALNDHWKISKETKQRVREAADQLGYVANLSARLIRGDAGLQVGLLIPDIQNDFYSSISTMLAERCRSAGLRLLLGITEDDPITEHGEIRAMLEARVSGLIATLTSKPLPRSLTLLQGRPSVQLVRRLPKLHTTAVCIADEIGCRMAAEHLFDLGHRQLAYVGTSKTISAGRDRLKGFLRAHELRGLSPPAGAIELVPPRQQFGMDAVARVLSLEPRPSAIVIGSSELTIGGLRMIGQAGLRIPEDISVVGYGDPVWFELLRPALTAVSLPVSGLADAAAQRLFDQIRGGVAARAGMADIVRVEPTLVVRGSTARFGGK
jgi:LacI family transcriptional regulator